MRVTERLRINNAVVAISAGAVLAVLLVTGRQVVTGLEQNRIADAMMAAQFERLALRTDYMRGGSDRARQQVQAKNAEVGRLLTTASRLFTASSEKKTVAALMANQESTGKIFRAILANRRQGAAEGAAGLHAEIEDRLLSQLNMRVYEAVLLAGRLQESTNRTVLAAMTSAGWWIAGVFLVMGTATVINSRRTNRAISSRIDALREGAAVIGEGALDHRIALKGKDEFAELAASFNEMTAKLGASYRHLEREIEERKEAEELLRRTAAELVSANSEISDSRRAAVNLLEDALDARRTAEEAAAALRARESDLSEAQRLAHIGSWAWDAMTDVTTGSDELLRIYGLDPATQRMPNFTDQRGSCYPVADWERVNAAVRRALETGIGYELDVQVIRKGTNIWVTTRCEAARDGNDRIVGLRGTVQDITERKRAEEALQKAHDELTQQMEVRTRELREKEVLLKEVHHRVKNNLQVISSLVGMQADASGDQAVREVLRDVTFRVRSMALVHEKLYRSESLARIEFAEYTRSLLNYLWRAHGAAAESVRLNLELEPVSLPVDIAVPCGLILNELAGNALKHAFRGRSHGEVTVKLGEGAGLVSLSVQDDGVGLPAGFDWRQASSLGLRLVQMLAGQLDAATEVRGGDGTVFVVNFKPPG